jgi:hypothetical protein
MSPAFAASAAVAARALGPSSATSADSVPGPRELLITTLSLCLTASRATWLPMWPAPMSPIVFTALSFTANLLSFAHWNRDQVRTLGLLQRCAFQRRNE